MPKQSADAIKKPQVWVEALLGGIDGAVFQRDSTATDIVGALFGSRGVLQKAGGIQELIQWSSDPLSSSTVFRLALFTHHNSVDIVMAHGGKIQVIQGKTVKTIATGRHDPASPREADRMVQIDDVLIITNGRDPNIKWDGHNATSPLGITSRPAPPQTFIYDDESTTSGMWSPLAITQGNNHEFSHAITWVNDKGQESNASPASFTVSESDHVGANRRYGLAVYHADEPPSDDIVERNVYRSTDGITFKFVGNYRGVKSRTFFESLVPGTEGTTVMPGSGTNTAPPVSVWCFPFRGRVYYLPADERSTLVYSNAGAKEAASTVNRIDVSGRDGEDLVAWAVPSDYALVFKRNSIHRITHDKYGLPIIRPESASVGAVSDGAVATFEGRTYFLHRTGMYIHDGGRVVPLATQLSEAVADLPGAYLEDAFMWVDVAARNVMLSINAGPGASNNQVWSVDVDTTQVTRLPFKITAAIPLAEDVVVGFLDGSSNSKLGLWGSGDDVAGVAFEGQYTGRWLHMGRPQADKIFHRLDVWFVQTGSHNLTVDVALDWDDRSSNSGTLPLYDTGDEDGVGKAPAWSDGNWGAARSWDGPRLRSVRFNLEDRIGKAIRFKLGTTAADTPWRLVRYEVHYAEHGVRSQGLNVEANPDA